MRGTRPDNRRPLDTYGHIFKKQGEEQTLKALEKWEAQTF
jgi:hypothetical protein